MVSLEWSHWNSLLPCHISVRSAHVRKVLSCLLTNLYLAHRRQLFFNSIMFHWCFPKFETFFLILFIVCFYFIFDRISYTLYKSLCFKEWPWIPYPCIYLPSVWITRMHTMLSFFQRVYWRLFLKFRIFWSFWKVYTIGFVEDWNA